MSLLPEKRKCPNCGRWYSFNPDVGKMFCPYCKNDHTGMEVKPPTERIIGGIRVPKLPGQK